MSISQQTRYPPAHPELVEGNNCADGILRVHTEVFRRFLLHRTYWPYWSPDRGTSIRQNTWIYVWAAFSWINLLWRIELQGSSIQARTTD